MKQNRRQQAQHRKAHRNNHIGDAIACRRGCHADQRANIPEKCEAGGNGWQQAAVARSSAPVEKEKIKQDTERKRSRAMANGVDQKRCVETQPIGHPAKYNSETSTVRESAG